MYGLAAIQQGNGWMMAGLGACIVLTGLGILSFLVSRIHRVVDLFESRKQDVPAPEPPAPPKAMAPEQMPEDLDAACVLCMDLTQGLGEAFCLADLHTECKASGIPDPHFLVNQFRDAGLLVPAGESLFAWKTTSA